MNRTKRSVLNVAMLAIGVLGSTIVLAAEVNVKLSGANEVPPVAVSGTGTGKITVGDDGSLSGSVTTTGVAGMAAHIHLGAAGTNGPVVVPLTKDGDTYKVPPGAKLNADQLKAFKAGDLYINVHTAVNKGGEIRGQLK
jgi:CHRD domain-containing protein